MVEGWNESDDDRQPRRLDAEMVAELPHEERGLVGSLLRIHLVEEALERGAEILGGIAIARSSPAS